MLLDLRCPRCNQPVYGKDEVKTAKAWRHNVTCQHCNTNVTATVPHVTDLGNEVYYKLTEDVRTGRES